jgi:capsid protein
MTSALLLALVIYTPFTGVAGCFAYDATASTPRRKAPSADMRSEDEILRLGDRDKLVSSARDAKRNYAVASWAIRKHLDFISTYHFQANTPNKAFNQAFSEFIKRWSHPDRCHVSGRHRLGKLIRMAEACRTLDGDCLLELMRDGSLNLIRGDRLRNPRGAANTNEWKHGIRINPRTHRPIEFQIHKRTLGGRFVPDKKTAARNAIHHGYFDDPEQIRGVSPLSAAINNLRDSAEAGEYALARIKAEMLLGVVVTTLPPEGWNPFQGNSQFAEFEDETDEEVQERADEEAKRGLVDYGRGLFQWEMRPGEDVKTVAGNMPSSNAQAFIDTSIMIALKALDLPFSFFRENYTNFFGSRGALQLYKTSAWDKIADNQQLLRGLTNWRTAQAIIENELELPRGWRLQDLEYAWVPKGIPWWDRAKEVKGDKDAIACGLDTPQNVVLEHGTGTFEENVDQIAEAVEYWQEKLGPLGIPISFASAPQVNQQMSELTDRLDEVLDAAGGGHQA